MVKLSLKDGKINKEANKDKNIFTLMKYGT